MTLIEVVAGLALMAAVLVLVFAVKSHLARQQARADRRLRAVAAADALLAGWWQQDLGRFPRSGSGPVLGQPDLVWRTRPLTNATGDAVGAQVVRLEVSPANGGLESEATTVSVEVVLPIPTPATAPSPASTPHPRARR